MSKGPARHLHPSNLVTYLSLTAGLLAVVAALEFGSRALAGGLIALSVLADTLDGRFARLFERDVEQRRFGVELDSLSDAVSFGLVPVGCVYALLSFTPGALRWIWYAAALFYVVSAMTRLGFYNIRNEQITDFIGVPAPVCGLLWSSYLLLRPSVTGSLVLLVVCGIGMVCSIRIPRPTGVGLHAFMSWSILLTIVHWAWMWGGKGGAS